METVGRENMPEGGVSTREAPRRESQSLGAARVAAETGLSKTGPRPCPARSAARRLSGLGARPHPWHRPRLPSPVRQQLLPCTLLAPSPAPPQSPQTRQPGRGYSGAHFTDEKTEAQAG